MVTQDIIKVPYTTIPRMEKYEGPLICTPYQHHLKEKQKELLFQGENIWFQSDLAYQHKMVCKVSKLMGFEPEYDIRRLGLRIQEDLVIVHRGRLEAAFVAFPSGWKPGDKQGQTLEQIHKPVADGDVLRKHSNRIAQMMCGDNRYHRYVWTLTTSNLLSAYPEYKKPDISNVDNLWLRTEHQITFPIEKGTTSGFLINVMLTPYWLLTDCIKKKIKNSINSMSESVLAYKNLQKIKELFFT